MRSDDNGGTGNVDLFGEFLRRLEGRQDDHGDSEPHLGTMMDALNVARREMGMPPIEDPFRAVESSTRGRNDRSRSSPDQLREGVQARRQDLVGGLANRRACTDGSAHANLVPLDSISATAVSNARLIDDPAAQEALTESIRERGILQPVVVAPMPGRPGMFSLVAGFRRHRAACTLGWNVIPATILPAGVSDKELLLINVAENGQRRNLSDFEMATRARQLIMDHGVPLAEVVKAVGLSPGRVNNLVRFLNVLPEDVLRDWRAGHPLMTCRILERMAMLDKEGASAFWASWRQRFEKSTDPANAFPQPRRSFNRPGGVQLLRLHAAIEHSPRLSDETRKLCLSIVEFCQGITDEVPGIHELRHRRRRSPARKAKGNDRELSLPRLFDKDGLPLEGLG
jgi:ParB/RepB/Spo0J family partition protein